MGERISERDVSLSPRLGVDIGRVILANATDVDSGIFSSSRYLEADFNDGAIEALGQIASDPRWDGVFLVSKCGPVVQERTLEVFEHNGFFERTGILRPNVHFCRTIAGKAPIAAALGLTHFVDDKRAVLDSLPKTVVSRLQFYEDPYEMPRSRNKSSVIVRAVSGWPEAFYALEESLAKYS